MIHTKEQMIPIIQQWMQEIKELEDKRILKALGDVSPIVS